MKIDSVTLEYKVDSHFQNLLEHQRQGLFNGYIEVLLKQHFFFFFFTHDDLYYQINGSR